MDGSDRVVDFNRAAPAETVYRCGPAARWLPRVLAASLLTAVVLAAFRFDPAEVLSVSRPFRILLSVLGGAMALWVLRRGGELRLEYVLRGDELAFRLGAREHALLIADLDRLAYETPFAQSRTWVPALVLRDRFAQTWRVPAFLEDGDRFLDDLLGRGSRNDLRAWADTLGLGALLARTGRRVAIGYASCGVLIAAGLAYYLH